MSSMLNTNRQRMSLTSNNDNAATINRKRPATSLSNASTYSTSSNKRPQPHRVSIAVERVDTKYSDSIGPQRSTLSESMSSTTVQQQQQPLPTMPRLSMFTVQNSSRRTSSFVRNPNTSSLPERVIQKFNTPDKAIPRRSATNMTLLKHTDTQRKYLRALAEYLNESNSGIPLPKNIRMLSGKDFQTMFRFFIEKLLPNHIYEKKFEDEAMEIIKALQYPLIDTINSKDLLAIGALHSIPAFYALLNWLMQCCKQKDRIVELQKNAGNIKSLTDSITSGKMFHSYCVESYKVFLSGSNVNLDTQTRLLKAKFDKAESEFNSRIEQLENKKNLLQKEYEILTKHKPPVQVLQNQLDLLTSDKAKYIKANEDKQARINKYTDQNARVQKEIDRMANTRNQMKAERDEILANWRARGTSLEEIEGLEKFHRQVSTELTEQSTKYEELMRSIHDMETKSYKAKLEIEASIQDYNNKINVIPNAENMKIAFNEHGKDAREMLGVDLDGDIMPRLENYDTDLKNQSIKLTETNLIQREQVNHMRLSFDKKTAKLELDKERVEKLNEEYMEAHTRAQENNNKDNRMRDEYEANKKLREENIHRSHTKAINQLQEKKTMLEVESQRMRSERAELESILEIKELEVRQLLQNLQLTTDNLKREVINSSSSSNSNNKEAQY